MRNLNFGGERLVADGFGDIGIGSVRNADEAVLTSKNIESIKGAITSVDDAHRWGDTHFSEWLDSLSSAEKSAIQQYTGSDYRKINSYLRGISDSLDDIEPSVIDNIKSGLGKSSVPHDVQVYRGTDMRPFEDIIEIGKDGSFNYDSLIGKTIKDDGFVSTAIVQESSFDFFDVAWEINVPKGAEGAYIGNISNVPSEAELLLNAGQEMLIKSVDVGIDGKINIVFDLISKK
ncbi:ADP-ribosyltransferase [Listeria sp. FSL L7-1582]|nr:ADP-ribosyltransferase [Listeria portnoyi]